MFSAVRRLFGSVDVREEGDLIVISGLPGDRIAREIYRYWATSRIEKFMFVRFTNSRISFYKFYAIEFLYMLNTLAEDRKSNVGRKVYLNLIELLKKNTWVKDIEMSHPPVLDRSKINVFHKTPLPHQVKFFDIYDEMVPRYHFNGYVLALDTGAGKTLTSLMTAEALRSDHIVTLCPTRALYNVWRKAYETEYKKPVDNWVSRDNLPFPKDPPKGIIINYEFLDQVMQDIINRR